MKRLFLIMVAILLVSSLLLAGCGETATPTTPASTATAASTPTSSSPTTSTQPTATAVSAGKTYKFSYSNFFPPTHLNSILAEMWCKEITTRTNGAVQFDYFPGGSLTAANKIYDGVTTGISTIGMSIVSYTPGRFPASELIEMPHGYATGFVATKVAQEFYDKFQSPEFKDVHVLFFHAHGPGVILTTKTPVRKLEDFKGLVLRSTGVGASVVTALGASGYAAAQNEAYELMSKGVIAGSLTPREVLEGWKQAEVVNYITNCLDVGYTANNYVVMNKTQWDSLPADIQQIFTDVSKEYVDAHAKVWTHYDKSAVEYFKTMPNREVIELEPAEMARWVEKVQPLVDKYISDLKAKGLPADEMEQFIVERVKYWNENAPPEEEASQWVKENVIKK